MPYKVWYGISRAPLELGSNRESTEPDLNTAVTMSTTFSTFTNSLEMEFRYEWLESPFCI
jgi:hypothetical protein